MSFTDFSAKAVTCKINLKGGKEVELTFRPFELADIAWIQNEFDAEEKLQSIIDMKVVPLCKIIWHQLDDESKIFFSNITYEEFNEDTEEVEVVKLIGYEKFMRAADGQENMLKAYVHGYLKVQNVNSFIEDEKKKKMKIAA